MPKKTIKTILNRRFEDLVSEAYAAEEAGYVNEARALYRKADSIGDRLSLAMTSTNNPEIDLTRFLIVSESLWEGMDRVNA